MLRNFLRTLVLNNICEWLLPYISSVTLTLITIAFTLTLITLTIITNPIIIALSKGTIFATDYTDFLQKILTSAKLRGSWY